ncbi:hypothetical protein AB205_0015230 [Aquarana catesbeiana]|uniref:Myb/SANT-like DNA-binding domain-containing protein n=1 Tax=Aquarana catesbeiana TaxID=8400 RepID=A0A2G9RR39_AQUCT|nr:hypothetical protein AB205_0015230 [Aquarana catesbeiana]
MAERISGSSAEENPEPQSSTSRRRYKATNMAFEEMVEMVSTLRREDYDGKKGPYTRPNMRKDKIMSSIVTTLEAKFGTKRSKEQLRKRWSDIKSWEPEQYWRIKKLLKKVNYLIKSEISLCFNYAFCSIIIGEKRLRQQSKDPRTPPSHQPEAEDTPSPRPCPPNDLEEGEVEKVCEVSSPPSEFLVVEGQAAEPFTKD